MAFNIVSWTKNTELESLLASRLEDLPLCFVSFAASSLDTGNIIQWLGSQSPAVLVNFLPSSVVALSDGDVEHATMLAEYAKATGTPIIQLSSYLVLGESDRPVSEHEPICVGTAATAERIRKIEEAVLNADKGIVLRCSWNLNAPLNSVFSEMCPFLLDERRADQMVSDHRFGAPVSQEFVVQSVVAVCQQVLCGSDNWGVYHLHSADRCSEAEIADQLVRVLKSECGKDVSMPDVAGVDDDRWFFPGNGNMEGRRATHDFGIQMPTWRKGFKSFLVKWVRLHCA